jgi:hypothetical protein
MVEPLQLWRDVHAGDVSLMAVKGEGQKRKEKRTPPVRRFCVLKLAHR